MNSYIWPASVILMLLIAPAVFSSIEEDGGYEGDADGGWCYTSASASAGGEVQEDYASGEGWNSKITTEGHACYWSFYVYAWGEADLYLYSGETCGAMGGGSASASCPHDSGSRSAHASLQSSGWGGSHLRDEDAEDPPGLDRGGCDWFDAWSGVYGYHYGYAGASAGGSSDSASGHGCVDAVAGLSEY